jgi:hypothetical protein
MTCPKCNRETGVLIVVRGPNWAICPKCIEEEKIHWYIDSPKAGGHGCWCSWCHKLIAADVLPVRFTKGRLEARFHPKCLERSGVRMEQKELL